MLVVGILLVLAIGIAASAELHGAAERAIDWTSRVIEGHPAWGTVAFVLLAAGSAMFAFFSSVVLVPIAVAQWGNLGTGAMLWLGWMLGGATAYTLGRFLGARVVRAFVSPEHVAYYQQRITRHAPFPVILLVQSALPSEIPGYLLGTARYPFAPYFLALAIAELPYAVGTVLLSSGFINRQYWLMIVIGALGLGLMAWAAGRLRKTLAAEGQAR